MAKKKNNWVVEDLDFDDGLETIYYEPKKQNKDIISTGLDLAGGLVQGGINTIGTIGGNLVESASHILKEPKAFVENGIDLSDPLGTAKNYFTTAFNTGIDAQVFLAKGFFGTLEGVADFLQYTSADNAHAFSEIGKMAIGDNPISDLYGGYAKWLKGNAEFDSTAALIGQDPENSLFENLMWAKGNNLEKLNQNIKKTTGKDLGLDKPARVFTELGYLNDEGKTHAQVAQDYSILGSTGESIFEGIGNIGAMAAMSAVGGELAGAAGLTTSAGELSTLGKLASSGIPSYTSAYGNARTKAYKDGASDSDARKYATISGFAEAISEQFFDAMPGVKSANILGKRIPIKSAITDRLEKSFGSNVGKLFLKFAGGLEEGSEEIISNVLVTLGSELLMLDKNYQYNPDNLSGDVKQDIVDTFLSQESWDAFFSAGFTSALLGGGEIARDTATRNQIINAYAKDNNMSFKEAKQLLTGETLESTKQGMDRADYDTNVEFNEAAEKRILNYMEQHTGENIESRIEDLIKVEEQNKGIEYSEEDRAKLAEKIRKDLIDRTNNPDKYSSFRMDEASEEEKNSQLYKDFNRLANNTKESHKLYNFYKALKGRNENSVFELTNNEELVKEGYLEKKDGKYGRTIDGKFVEEIPNGINLGNKILINADGLNAFEATTWHEIAHSIKDSSPEGYNELKQIVKDYYGENDYQKYEQKYRDLYGDSDLLEDEYVNDKLGEMLNNEDFIERISGNQSLLQTLINKIKRTIKYMTSGKEQKRLMKLQDQLEKKYTELYGEAKFEGDESLPFYGGEDARYSLTQDNTGKELSKEQQEFFKDSKVRDQDGRLLEVYHGTPNGEFFEFNKNYLGETSLAEDARLGFHFTDNKVLADYFSKDLTDDPDVDRPVVMSQYLNIKKPLSYFADYGISEEQLANDLVYISTGETDVTNVTDTYENNMEVLSALQQDFDNARAEMKDMLATPEAMERIRELGYDGLILPMASADSKTILQSGNEYIIFDSNQTKNTDNVNPTSSPDIRYSLSKDAQGKELSKQQQEYFKDSKIRDTEGRLIPMYHGTPNGEFTIFRPGSYFSSNKEYAQGYENTWASAISSGKEAINPKTYEVYLNITNPFSIQDNTAKDIYLNEYIKGGNSLYFDPYTDYTDTINNMDEIDWTEGEDLREWLLENHPEYDGLVLDEGGDGGYGEAEYRWRGKSYMPFNSNQVKNIDNTNPTSNQDIRYSLSKEGLENLSKELGESYSMLESNLTGRDRAGIKRYLENYTNIVDKYLADNNIEVEPAYRDIEFTRVRTPELQQFVKDNELTIEKLANDQELQDKYFDLWFGDNNEEKFTKQWRDLFDFVRDNPREDEVPRPLRSIQREMEQIRNGETQEIDESATKSKKLDAAIDNGYDFWIEDQITPLFEKIDYDPDEVMEEAKANHGTTDNYAVGAYMTTDGSLLNFNDGGYRDDHRTISVFNLDMNEFMDYGAIRMKPEGNGFEMAVEPTADQYSRLEDYIDSYLKTSGQEIYVDFDIPGTNNYDSASYNPNTPTSKIINDIKTYYETGNLPQQSEYADFYYSLSKNEQPQRTTGTYSEDIAIPTIDYNLPTTETIVETQNVPVNERTTTEDRLAEQRRKLADKRIKTMIEKQTYKSVKQATKIAKDYLGFDSKETQQFREGIEDLARKRKDNLIKAENYQEVKDLVGQYANRDMTFVSEELKEAQKDVRHTQLIVSDDLKDQITDWTDFRKKSGLNIKKGQKSNVDVVYQEFCDMYPGMFDDTITNYADQLQAMSEFVHKDNKFVETYTLSDETLNQITNRVWEKLSQNALTKQDFKDIEDTINKQVERRTREVVRNALLDEMGITLDDIDVGKDITSIAYQRTDPKRLNEKVFGYDIGQKVNDATVNFVGHQEAERTRFLNNERNDIEELGIKARSKESAAVQKYGEKQYVNDKGELVEYNDRDLMSEFPRFEDQQKIKNAAKALRAKYDEYIDLANDKLVEMGYDPIPKRQDYFKHFTELQDKFSQWGIPFSRENLTSEELSTDINGLTDQFKPGKNFFASAMERKGIKTTYDAITGIDSYLEGISNLIYHTESIQRYRALSKMIRDTYGQTHGLENLDTMTEEEAAKRVEDVYNNKLTRYAAWLDEQANSLAGKKGAIDRSMERFMGRKAYTFLNALKSQVGSNMTGFNVRSAMTNFASAIQGASKTQKISFLEGTAFAVKNYLNEDSDLINKSDFLTRRFGSDALSQKTWQKISAAGQVFMSATDRFTSLQIWGGKYYEGLNSGLTQEAAIKQADDFAARIMGDRSKGQTAEIFNSKTLGLLTQFQLEVNNQWSSMMHDNKMEMQKNPGLKTSMKIVGQLGQLYAFSYMFNGLMKALTGSDVMFDPIDILKGIIAPDDEDEEKTLEERATEAIGKIIDQLPMASIFTGGRIPISEAFTGVGTLAKKLTGQKDNYGNEYTWDDVKDDLIASAFYYLLPTGYGQIKKTAQGLGQYGQILPEPIERAMDIYHNENLPIAGNYTKAGKLKYEADTSTFGKIQSGLFGRNASANAVEYREMGYSPLSEKKAQEAYDANLPISEYRRIDKGIKDAAAEAKENNESQSNAKAEYIYNLPLKTDQKNILVNGALNRKNPIDMTDYGKYGSLEEFDYANKNPEKYLTLTQIADYDSYQEYEDVIQKLKKAYTDKNARKRAIHEYIDSLNLNMYQKLMLENQAAGYSIKNYKSQVRSYIDSLNLSAQDKQKIDKELFGGK